MSAIRVLSKQVSTLIAAGEVVDRPASVIKELVENAVDAGSTAITVEIQHGGITLMRVTDNGCGIAREDVQTAFLRHATSKIQQEQDLDAIHTLGFRGEALAAISSVSKVELLTKTSTEQIGTKYTLVGGESGELCDAGCPNGTTIVIKDLFFNTPARMKFLKKDVSEGNAVAALVDRLALSHPEIAVRFIRDGKMVLSTQGQGEILPTIYSVCGRDFANAMLPVSNAQGVVLVEGCVCKPVSCRPNRNGQYVFINGRYVRSGTVIAALEQAYKNSAMVGKFPAAVLYLTLPAEMVDVNVHPAKTEVRFQNEKIIFDCVYYAVKNTLSNQDDRPEIKKTPVLNPFAHISAQEYRQAKLPVSSVEQAPVVQQPNTQRAQTYLDLVKQTAKNVPTTPVKPVSSVKVSDIDLPYNKGEHKMFYPEAKEPIVAKKTEQMPVAPLVESQPVFVDQNMPIVTPQEPDEEEIIYIGEAFKTYILAQKGEQLYLIDKHAAHERILYNKFSAQRTVQQQMLLMPQTVTLSKDEYNQITQSIDLLEQIGFSIEDFGQGNVLVRAVPAELVEEDLQSILEEIAENLAQKFKVEIERLDRLYHTIACKAAIKAGNLSDVRELCALAQTVLSSKEVLYCPHGRPVAFALTKREIEKNFGRIQG